MKKLLTAALFATFQAQAACDPVEYVEVKDWKPAAISEAYCADYDRAKVLVSEELAKAKVYGIATAATAYDPLIARCSKQMNLYERVLKNLHGKETPQCAAKAEPPK
jgi:hypothetical protein